MRDAVIVSAVRTAVGKAPKGTLRATRPDDLAAVAIHGALARVPNLNPQEVEDVIIGCAMPEGEQGMNVARIAALRAGLPIESAAMTINRYCASGLQSIALAAERIRGGGAEVIVAGGTESMSLIPMGGNKISINPWLAAELSGLVPFDGADRRAGGAALRHLAPAGRRVRPGQPHQGAGRPGRRQVPAGDRAGAGDLLGAGCEVEDPQDRSGSSRWTKGRAPILPWRRWASSRPPSTPRARSRRATPRRLRMAPRPRW